MKEAYAADSKFQKLQMRMHLLTEPAELLQSIFSPSESKVGQRQMSCSSTVETRRYMKGTARELEPQDAVAGACLFSRLSS